MKKAVYLICAVLLSSTLVTACEAEPTDEQIEILSPDKDKDEPIGGGHDSSI